MSGSDRPEGRHAGAAGVLLPWLAPAALSIYVKMIVLLQVGVCLACFRLSGQSWAAKFGEVSFFRLDALLALVVVPGALLLVARVAPPGVAAWTTATVSTVLFALLFTQLQCLETVGTFISVDLLRDALVWAWEDPGHTGAYFTGFDKALLAGGLVWIAGSIWWSHRRERSAATAPLVTGRIAVLARRAGTAVLLVAILLPWTPRIAETPYHRSALSWTLFPARDRAVPRVNEFSGLSAASLAQRYRELSGAPAAERDPRYWATMSDSDVVFFIFETGPAACLDLEGDLTDFPNLQRLRSHSFIAPRHFSTAPLTNRALFSIFSSWYPSTSNFDRAFGPGQTVLPGLVSRAAEAGYQTAVYSRSDPSQMVPGDTARLRALGFRDIRIPEGSPGRRTTLINDVDREEATLALLKTDMARWTSDDQRFVAAFLPQLGHAPWLDATEGRAQTVVERGRALMALQDRLLGEIVDELQRQNRLDRTVIVVTADHGIRTRKEDADFRVGLIDDYTFHVPLQIFAPRSLDSSRVVPGLTSHIDIAPTVLDLLGLERNTDLEQGAPIWRADTGDRQVFQLARLYLGSDGIAQSDRFAMYGYLTDHAYEAPRMHFEAEHPLSNDSAAATAIVRRLERFNALQAEWTVAMSRRSSQ